MYWYPYVNTVREGTRSRSRAYELVVLGEGMKKVEPDIAIVTIGIISEGQDLEQIQEQNSETSERVIQALSNLSISEKNIRTVEYRVEQMYDFIDGKRVFRGYEVRHLLEVEVEGIKRIGTVVDQAIKSGANIIYNIRFDYSNRDFVYQEALSFALKDATKKAETLAKSMGVNLSRIPFSIQETGTERDVRPFQPMVLSQDSSSTPIQAGQLEIKASLIAKFAYMNL